MGRMGRNVLFNDTLNTFILIIISHIWKGRKEGNVLFNDALNTFILIVISHIWIGRKRTQHILFTVIYETKFRTSYVKHKMAIGC